MEDNLYEKVIYESNYFKISELYYKNRKTPVLTIYSKEGYNLGEIRWYGAWRKFCFYPNEDTIWDNKCLEEIVSFLNKYNKDWRNKSEGKV